MDGSDGRPAWEGRLAPRWLLLGFVLSFLACCGLGRLVSRQNPFKGFERFHSYLNYLSLFYPTVSQTRAIARSAVAPDQIAVVVGGSSIMHGSGQGDRYLWTRRLQELLGPRYRVINFAIPGTPPGEFAPVAAEVIQRDHPKLILVTNNWAGTAGSAGEVDGRAPRYFFWDAYSKGLLLHSPEREARLAELLLARKEDEAFAEERCRTRLDRWSYAQDLWTTFSYRCANTVWCPPVAESLTAPRRRYESHDPEMPPDAPHPPEMDRQVLADFTAQLPNWHWPHVTAGPAGVDYGETPLVLSFKRCVPEPYRRRTLVVFNHLNPKYVGQLAPAIQARNAADYPESVCAMRQAGFAAMELGKGYTPRDYYDPCHFSLEGAVKMAAEIAPQVRQMAHDLGYTD